MEIKNVELNNNGMNITFNTKEKDYMYDSLCYRYIRAREQMAEYEYLRDCQSNKKMLLIGQYIAKEQIETL